MPRTWVFLLFLLRLALRSVSAAGCLASAAMWCMLSWGKSSTHVSHPPFLGHTYEQFDWCRHKQPRMSCMASTRTQASACTLAASMPRLQSSPQAGPLEGWPQWAVAPVHLEVPPGRHEAPVSGPALQQKRGASRAQTGPGRKESGAQRRGKARLYQNHTTALEISSFFHPAACMQAVPFFHCPILPPSTDI